ncbi:PPP4R3 [Mytilus edulis]|uniref:SMEK n=1 Tax=Mytilus edulis TaxID=6550 RepID=A0A8S3PRH0_MYTED|nr:PPP4R3 [Mytilus edulis]
MATLDIDTLEKRKENYDKLLAVFHIGTDVKRSLLQFYLHDKKLSLLEFLTKISKTLNFLQFEDVKLARKRSSFIQPADLGLNTVDTVLKYNCFDIFWDCCLLNTSLEDILNHHKEKLYSIYLHSNKQHDLPNMSTEYSSSYISKDHWEFLFKTGECRKMIEDDNVENIFASKGITVSRLDSNLNIVILETVCPLFKSLLALSECQIGISKTAVNESDIQTSAFHDTWNQIEMHILRLGKHCKSKDYFRRKCIAVKRARFNKTLAQENRKRILDEAFNNPEFIDDARLFHRIQEELDLIALEDTLHSTRTLRGRKICVPLVGGQYEPGKYSQCVVENAEKDLQICKSVCDTEPELKGDFLKIFEKHYRRSASAYLNVAAEDEALIKDAEVEGKHQRMALDPDVVVFKVLHSFCVPHSAWRVALRTKLLRMQAHFVTSSCCLINDNVQKHRIVCDESDEPNTDRRANGNKWYGIAQDVLVFVLKERLPLTDYGEAFNGMKTRIYQLLDNRERQLLFPDNSKYSGNLSDLDIGLLYIILRNINNICPHDKGWGQKPKDDDRTLSANIDRIRFMKNKYVSHSTKCSLNERKFLKTWKNIGQCVSELGGPEYEQRVARLFTTEINPVLENELITVQRTSRRQKDRKSHRLKGT